MSHVTDPMFAFLNSLRALSCLKQQHTLIDSPSSLHSCTFCDVSVNKGFQVIWEDDAFVVFSDRLPAAQHHLLVVPKEHIESVKSLQKSDVPLVKSMQEIGHKVLDDLNVSPSMRKMGFHIPPFSSVYHLHLHVQALPYKYPLRAAKYPFINGFGPYAKGLSWFAEVGQTIRILERGERVRIFPS